tara:strand:+ start:39758 stop:40360 length:603 start_codon:yes stop_codon:yes gene_type:complete
MYYPSKSEFELFFLIINTKECDLFTNDDAYDRIKGKYELSACLLKETDIEMAYLADFYFKRFTFPPDKVDNLDKICSDALYVLGYLNNGGKLGGSKGWYERFLSSRAIHDRLYLVQDVKYDNQPCTSPRILELLIRQCEVIQNISEMAKIWNVEVMEFTSMVQKYNFLKNITEYANETLFAYKKGVLAVDQLVKGEGFLS